jgi:predicted nucleic acid-binding protein
VANLLVLDTNVLWSFAVVQRLDLLEVRFASRLVWTDAVRGEIIRNTPSEPRLQAVIDSAWLGEPVEFTAADLLPISRLRGSLATPGEHPAMHLGEAESIYLIQSRANEATFVTDDGPAADLAKRRGLRVQGTLDLMQDCHAMGEIGCPAAWELMLEMERGGRHVRTPAHHSKVC